MNTRSNIRVGETDPSFKGDDMEPEMNNQSSGEKQHPLTREIEWIRDPNVRVGETPLCSGSS